MTWLADVSKASCGHRGDTHDDRHNSPGVRRRSPLPTSNCESAIYVVKGRGRFLSGERLQNADEIGPGDFIYVPPNSVHQPINGQHVGADGADSSEEHAS